MYDNQGQATIVRKMPLWPKEIRESECLMLGLYVCSKSEELKLPFRKHNKHTTTMKFSVSFRSLEISDLCVATPF